MHYSHILFDLDGTLTESGIGITNSIKYALSKLGVTSYDEELFKQVVGPPLSYSFGTLFGIADADMERAISFYREYFSVTGIFENRLYDGVDTMLNDLQKSGCMLYVATSKPENYAVQILEYFGILKYFTFVGAATLDPSRNSKIDVLRHTLAQIHDVPTEKILMVGDKYHDLDAAEHFGIDAIGVLYGYGTQAELENCKNVFLSHTPISIRDFIIT